MNRVILVLLAAILAALLWGASELHYRSCVDAAEARYPANAEEGIGLFENEGLSDRQAAVDECSRWSF